MFAPVAAFPEQAASVEGVAPANYGLEAVSDAERDPGWGGLPAESSDTFHRLTRISQLTGFSSRLRVKMAKRGSVLSG